MLPRPRSVLLAAGATLLGLLARPAAAQTSNLDTVEGPGAGEHTTLMVSPRSLTDDVSARALGVRSPDDVRFALTLIGIARSDSIRLTLNGKTLPVGDISRPAEGEVGPTQVYLSQETFLTLADRSGARLHIGDQAARLPDQMRTEMRKIFEEVV
jgi:hypothetical protein